MFRYMRIGIVGLLLALSIVSGVSVAQAYVSPGKPTGLINDYAGVLSPTKEAEIGQKLLDFSNTGKGSIVIAIIPSLAGDDIESYSNTLFNEWGIGSKKEHNGLLIVVAIAEHRMRIEVGYGLEPYVTDIQANMIINNVMKPAFRANDFAGGLNGSVDLLIGAIDKGIPISADTFPQSKEIPDMSRFQLLVNLLTSLLFSPLGLVFAIFLTSSLAKSRSWWAGGIVGLLIGFILGLLYSWIVAIVVSIVCGALGLGFDFIISRAYEKRKAQGARIPWWAGGFISGGGRGFGGGGGFGGGFGGGGSGGGGSSGSW